jgi:CHAT domain-containing protein
MMLLEYSLGSEHSYLWATTRESVTSYELPKRSEIDAAARALYSELTARQPLPSETQLQYLARVKEADTQYEREATALGKVLLGPVTALLGKKRLLIVADGSLGYLPFASLPSPAPGLPPRALIAANEIVYLPSASTLAVLRSQISGRARAPKTLAVFADPVFDKSDDRVSRGLTIPINAKQQAVNSGVAELGLRDAGMLAEALPLARLPFSRQEAEAIIALAPPGETLKAVGFSANLNTALSPELAHFRIVHFATHALVNPEHPYLTGLLLSLVDEQGQPQDGFLSLNQIYNLNLPADFVMLSACQTAKGKEVKGEGIIGLTRAFMYAGAPRVVASLWKVDDAATAEISKRFYRGFLKEGLRPAAALQAAQLQMSRHRLWHSPYYWAGFVLQGEPN